MASNYHAEIKLHILLFGFFQVSQSVFFTTKFCRALISLIRDSSCSISRRENSSLITLLSAAAISELVRFPLRQRSLKQGKDNFSVFALTLSFNDFLEALCPFSFKFSYNLNTSTRASYASFPSSLDTCRIFDKAFS